MFENPGDHNCWLMLDFCFSPVYHGFTSLGFRHCYLPTHRHEVRRSVKAAAHMSRLKTNRTPSGCCRQQFPYLSVPGVASSYAAISQSWPGKWLTCFFIEKCEWTDSSSLVHDPRLPLQIDFVVQFLPMFTRLQILPMFTIHFVFSSQSSICHHLLTSFS